MEKNENKNGQEKTVVETAPVAVEKKFLGLSKKAWKRIGIAVGVTTLAVGGAVAVKKYKASKANVTANEVEVAQPEVQEEKTAETPRENKNDRFGGNNPRRDRWNNNTNN